MRLLVSPTSAIPPPDLNMGPLLPPSPPSPPSSPSLNQQFTTRMFDSSTYYKGVQGIQGLQGLGQLTTQTAAGLAATGATTTASILVALGTIGGPIGAAIAAVAAIGVALVGVFKGCGATCVDASNYANQVEPILLQNLQAYLSSPVRTVSMQQAAVNNYNTAIASLEQACGQAQLGQAGQNCIDERVNASSCQWKAQAGGWTTNTDGTCTYTPWGASGSGSSCWNWVIGYLDPIQNDPCVQPDSAITSTSKSSGATAGNTSTLTNLTSGVSSALSSTVAIGSLNIPVWLLAGVAALLVLE